jgi:hypothetical protein
VSTKADELGFLAAILQPISTFVLFIILFLPLLNNETCKIKPRIAMEKAAISNKVAVFISKIGRTKAKN